MSPVAETQSLMRVDPEHRQSEERPLWA